MFAEGDYISYGCIGICRVEGTVMLDMEEKNKKREYYMLRPVYEQKRVIYCPVDNPKVSMRRKLTKEEGFALFDMLPQLEEIEAENKKMLEAKCKQALHSGECVEWMKVIKTLQHEKRDRRLKGKKITSSSEKYLHDAEEKLYGELAISLEKEKTQIEKMFIEKMEKCIN